MFEKGKIQELKSDIIMVIWVNFGVMTFWPWKWPGGSNVKMLMTIGYR